MDKPEILSPVKSFWDILQEKILNSQRFLSDKVGAFSTFSSAVFAWYYFTKCTNKLQFANADFQKNLNKTGRNSLYTVPYILVNKPIKEISTGGGDTLKLRSESMLKPQNKRSVINKNQSDMCSSLYSDEEMETLARKYDDSYKQFWENPILHSAIENDSGISITQLKDKVVPKLKETQNIETLIQCQRGEKKNDRKDSPCSSFMITTTNKGKGKKKKDINDSTPSYASMPIFKDSDKTEKRKRFFKTKRPNSSSCRDRKKKDNIDSNSNRKGYNRSLTDPSFQKLIKNDVAQIIEEKLGKEKDRRDRIEKMKKDREEMFAKIKADRKIRAEMVRKTKEQLALKEAEEQERKKKIRLIKERKRKSKEIVTNQSLGTSKTQSRSSSRGSALGGKKVLPRTTDAQTKDNNSIGSCPSLLSNFQENDKISDMFSDENLINETSKAFQKLVEAVKLYEKDDREDGFSYGQELLNHCKTELGKYKTLVEELKSLDTDEIQNNNTKSQTDIDKLEIIIHKKNQSKVPRPSRKQLENTV